MHFRIRHGLDVPVDGVPERLIDTARGVGSVGLVGADYVGLEPRLLAGIGDHVRLGQPLFQHKRDPAVVFTAPGSGTITAINRGARRRLKSVVIELAEPSGVSEPGMAAGVGSSPARLRQALLESGLWTAFRTRPFSRIPESKSDPDAIFVTAIDTRPLAADPELVVAGYAEDFSRGLDALTRLSGGRVFLCTKPGWQGPTGAASNVEHAVFDGPHPAGLPGTHVHHLAPVGPGRSVWHLGYQDVIAIGVLVGEGRIWTDRIVALGGNGFLRPRLVRTRLGTDIAELTTDECHPKDAVVGASRLISGSVLDGRTVLGSESYLGRYHLQISAIREPLPNRRLRWRRLLDGRFSFSGTFVRPSGHSPPKHFDTDQNGRVTALVPIDAFERLIPLDVLAEPLLRSLLIGDTEQAQALGCLELDEEDLALCSFICPGKNDYGGVLRANLEQIEREG